MEVAFVLAHQFACIMFLCLFVCVTVWFTDSRHRNIYFITVKEK